MPAYGSGSSGNPWDNIFQDEDEEFQADEVDKEVEISCMSLILAN
jgi:hypothetical protein